MASIRGPYHTEIDYSRRHTQRNTTVVSHDVGSASQKDQTFLSPQPVNVSGPGPGSGLGLGSGPGLGPGPVPLPSLMVAMIGPVPGSVFLVLVLVPVPWLGYCNIHINKYAIYAYTHGPVTGSGFLLVSYSVQCQP